ncbi:unnamed protein product, partial [Prorocentrum cordatum]
MQAALASAAASDLAGRPRARAAAMRGKRKHPGFLPLVDHQDAPSRRRVVAPVAPLITAPPGASASAPAARAEHAASARPRGPALAPPGPARAGRDDAPSANFTRGGSQEKALEATKDEHFRGAALKALQRAFLAASARCTTSSLARTRGLFRGAWFGERGPVVPPAPEKLQATGAVFKGPMDLDLIVDAVRTGCVPDDLPGVAGVPIGPANLAALAVFFLLREIEASLTVCRNVRSKADPMALSTSRTRDCVCTAMAPEGCPCHCAVSRARLVERHFANAQGKVPESIPFFPTLAGNALSKEATTATHEELHRRARAPTHDDEGNRLLGGHLPRMLARTGVHVYLIELVARWHAPMLPHHAREAPLHQISSEFVELRAMNKESGTSRDIMAKLESLSATPIEANSDLVDRARAWESAPRAERQGRAEHVKNDGSSVWRRLAVEGLGIPADQRRTTCGWRFAFHRYTLAAGCLQQGAERCEKCFPPASAEHGLRGEDSDPEWPRH